jgi:ABC-type nitrate/sulfonate/bicarbonate transport system ATPase subunit
MSKVGHTQAATARIEFRHVSKTFAGRGQAVMALRDVSFHVRPGELVTVIGPSGSGKSTLFNLCVGLIEPDQGEILFDGIKPSRRTGMVGYMPQHDLLLPWRSVLDNVVIPLEIQGVGREEARRRGLAMLTEFGLDKFRGEYPAALSGGMRQRVALLRTWLTGRATLLLDESFGALDAMTRRELRQWLLDVWEKFERTVVFITHDVEEAVYLADRVIVFSARPGTVRRELTISLPRPRRKEMIAEPDFRSLLAELLAELESGPA